MVVYYFNYFCNVAEDIINSNKLRLWLSTILPKKKKRRLPIGRW